MKSPRSQRIVQNGLPNCVLPRSPRCFATGEEHDDEPRVALNEA